MAMIMKSMTRESNDTDSTRTVLIISDTAPNSVSGDDITGMPDHLTCSPGSVCIDATAGKRYVLGIGNTWKEM